MNIELNEVLITVTIPKENAEELRKAICDAGAGAMGDYTYCTSNIITKGTFIPNKQSNPYIWEKEKLEIHSNNMRMLLYMKKNMDYIKNRVVMS